MHHRETATHPSFKPESSYTQSGHDSSLSRNAVSSWQPPPSPPTHTRAIAPSFNPPKTATCVHFPRFFTRNSLSLATSVESLALIPSKQSCFSSEPKRTTTFTRLRDADRTFLARDSRLGENVGFYDGLREIRVRTSSVSGRRRSHKN